MFDYIVFLISCAYYIPVLMLIYRIYKTGKNVYSIKDLVSFNLVELKNIYIINICFVVILFSYIIYDNYYLFVNYIEVSDDFRRVVKLIIGFVLVLINFMVTKIKFRRYDWLSLLRYSTVIVSLLFMQYILTSEVLCMVLLSHIAKLLALFVFIFEHMSNILNRDLMHMGYYKDVDDTSSLGYRIKEFILSADINDESISRIGSGRSSNGGSNSDSDSNYASDSESDVVYDSDAGKDDMSKDNREIWRLLRIEWNRMFNRVPPMGGNNVRGADWVTDDEDEDENTTLRNNKVDGNIKGSDVVEYTDSVLDRELSIGNPDERRYKSRIRSKLSTTLSELENVRQELGWLKEDIEVVREEKGSVVSEEEKEECRASVRRNKASFKELKEVERGLRMREHALRVLMCGRRLEIVSKRPVLDSSDSESNDK
jgi:hypothetical protein